MLIYYVNGPNIRTSYKVFIYYVIGRNFLLHNKGAVN